MEWVAISFSSAWKWKVKVKSLSRVQLFTTPWTVAYQAPPSIGFPRQEYWIYLKQLWESPCLVSAVSGVSQGWFFFFFYLHIGYACFFACLVIANWKLNILNNRMWQLWTSDILTSLKYVVVTLCWCYCLWLSWTKVCVLCCVWPLKSLLNQLRSQLNIGNMCP